MTDRFARTDGSTSATCDLNEYCGGTWQGLISRLDYIQQMGFTAVSTIYGIDLEAVLMESDLDIARGKEPNRFDAGRQFIV